MEDLVCSWSPKLIVDLIKSIAWPVVVLLIGFSFRTRIFEVARSFFLKTQFQKYQLQYQVYRQNL